MCNFLKIWVGLSLAKIVVLRFHFGRCTFTVLLATYVYLWNLQHYNPHALKKETRGQHASGFSYL